MQKRKVRIPLKGLLQLILSLFMCVNLCIAAEDPANFPTKPITLIVQWPAGGTTDLPARKLAELAGKILGQPIVVEDKVGGAGIIGTNAIAKADPDGYTIGTLTYSSTTIAPHLRSVPYDIKKDFSFLMQFGEYSMVFCVLADSPSKTFRQFIEEARKNPGKALSPAWFSESSSA